MKEHLNAFVSLAKLFSDNGYKLYLVGGTVRDFFLQLPLTDMDLVSDATPDEMEKFIPDADFTFRKYGSIKYVYNNIKFDITTLRVEKSYKDSRHPTNVKFVKSLRKDSKRRDLTINAMYLDDRFQIYDYHGGKNDLDNKIIKMVGNPKRRIKEDPLRIFRVIRFAVDFDFKIDDKLDKVLLKTSYLVSHINPDKIKQELSKIKQVNDELKEKLFFRYNLAYLLKGEK